MHRLAALALCLLLVLQTGAWAGARAICCDACPDSELCISAPCQACPGQALASQAPALAESPSGPVRFAQPDIELPSSAHEIWKPPRQNAS